MVVEMVRYLDGTRKIVPKNRNCLNPTYYPFWKKPIDVSNRVETRKHNLR